MTRIECRGVDSTTGFKSSYCWVEVDSQLRSVLSSILPHLIAVCCSAYLVGFFAVLFMDECWTRVIELDYAGMGLNTAAEIWLFKEVAQGDIFQSQFEVLAISR